MGKELVLEQNIKLEYNVGNLIRAEQDYDLFNYI